MKKAIFSDSLPDTKRFIASNKQLSRSPDALFVAMNPMVYACFKKNSLAADTTLPYFSNASHARALDRSEVMIKWLREKIQFENFDGETKEAYKNAFVFWTRIAIHYCIWAIEIAFNVMETHKLNKLSAFYSAKKKVLSLRIEPEERYLALLLRSVAEIRGIAFEGIGSSGFMYNDAISSYVAYVGAYSKVIMGFLTGLNRLQKPQQYGVILFASQSHQMKGVADQLRSAGSLSQIDFLEWPGTLDFRMSPFVINLFLKRKRKAILAQKRFCEDVERIVKKERELFSYRGTSFSEIIGAKIHDNIAPYLIGQSLRNMLLGKYLNRIKPSAILCEGNIEDIFLAELAKAKGIPSILLSHGSFVQPKNRHEEIEWKEQGSVLLNGPFSHIALQTPLSEGYLKTCPSSGEKIKTGPVLWGRPANEGRSEAIFKKLFKGRYNFKSMKVIVHAGTPKASNSLRFHVYETSDEYIEALRQVAEAVNDIPNVVLIIRFRPSGEIDEETLKALVPLSNKVVLSSEDLFSDILGTADLLMSFSSTAIEEALQNRIPVLLYGGGGRYHHIPSCEITSAKPACRSAVYHVKNTEDLKAAIDIVLKIQQKDASDFDDPFDRYIYPEGIITPLTDILNITKRNKDEVCTRSL